MAESNQLLFLSSGSDSVFASPENLQHNVMLLNKNQFQGHFNNSQIKLHENWKSKINSLKAGTQNLSTSYQQRLPPYLISNEPNSKNPSQFSVASNTKEPTVEYRKQGYNDSEILYQQHRQNYPEPIRQSQQTHQNCPEDFRLIQQEQIQIYNFQKEPTQNSNNQHHSIYGRATEINQQNLNQLDDANHSAANHLSKHYLFPPNNVLKYEGNCDQPKQINQSTYQAEIISSKPLQKNQLCDLKQELIFKQKNCPKTDQYNGHHDKPNEYFNNSNEEKHQSITHNYKLTQHLDPYSNYLRSLSTNKPPQNCQQYNQQPPNEQLYYQPPQNCQQYNQQPPLEQLYNQQPQNNQQHYQPSQQQYNYERPNYQGNMNGNSYLYNFSNHPNGQRRSEFAPIRKNSVQELRSKIKSGNITQVCGPPMVGKKTVIQEAIFQAQETQIITHHDVNCKNCGSLEDILAQICVQLNLCPAHLGVDYVVQSIAGVLQQQRDNLHVWTFSFCETFITNGKHHDFTEFLLKLSRISSVSVAVIFSTYKTFPTFPKSETISIPVLDFFEILIILRHFSDNQIEKLDYVSVLQNFNICFPADVLCVAVEYISGSCAVFTPEELEDELRNNKAEEVYQKWDDRVNEVESWVGKNNLEELKIFCHSIEASVSHDLFLTVIMGDNPNARQRRLQDKLISNFVLRQEPGVNRLRIHPLVVQYFIKKRSENFAVALVKDHSCNRFVQFFCHTISTMEAGILSDRRHRRRGVLLYLSEEWANIRNVLQLAISTTENTYKTFLQVGVHMDSILFKYFEQESIMFYEALLNSAEQYGTRCEQAVLRGQLGFALANARVTSMETGIEMMKQACEALKEWGSSFQYAQFICRIGSVLQRMGKYEESKHYLVRGGELLKNCEMTALSEDFNLPEAKRIEMSIKNEVQYSIPVTYLGETKKARDQLMYVLEYIENECPNHPDVPIILNQIGITWQRGEDNMEMAYEWYMKSYVERLVLEKLNPKDLLVPINNIAIYLLNKGQQERALQFLNRALDIRRRYGWRHYNTSLTLSHKAQVYVMGQNYVAAMYFMCESEKMLSALMPHHDYRLQEYVMLSHFRLALKRQHESQRRQPHTSQENHNTNNGNAESRTRDRNVPLEEGNVPVFEEILSNGHSTNIDNTREDNSNHVLNGQINPDDNITMQDLRSKHNILSTIQYLEKAKQFKETTEGNLSDAGYQNYLSALLHLMILHWENSREKFDFYRDKFLDFMSNDEFVVNKIHDFENGKSTVGFNLKLKEFLIAKEFLEKTKSKTLSIDSFVKIVRESCITCKSAENIFDETLWLQEAESLGAERKRIQDLQEKMETSKNKNIILDTDNTPHFPKTNDIKSKGRFCNQKGIAELPIRDHMGYHSTHSVEDNTKHTETTDESDFSKRITDSQKEIEKNIQLSSSRKLSTTESNTANSPSYKVINDYVKDFFQKRGPDEQSFYFESDQFPQNATLTGLVVSEAKACDNVSRSKNGNNGPTKDVSTSQSKALSKQLKDNQNKLFFRQSSNTSSDISYLEYRRDSSNMSQDLSELGTNSLTQSSAGNIKISENTKPNAVEYIHYSQNNSFDTSEEVNNPSFRHQNLQDVSVSPYDHVQLRNKNRTEENNTGKSENVKSNNVYKRDSGYVSKSGKSSSSSKVTATPESKYHATAEKTTIINFLGTGARPKENSAIAAANQNPKTENNSHSINKERQLSETFGFKTAEENSFQFSLQSQEKSKQFGKNPILQNINQEYAQTFEQMVCQKSFSQIQNNTTQAQLKASTNICSENIITNTLNLKTLTTPSKYKENHSDKKTPCEMSWDEYQ